MILWVLLSCQSSPAPIESSEAADCTQPYRESQNLLTPQAWAAELPNHEGLILFLAEHHSQAHQLDQLSRAIELMSSRAGPLWFAAEWLPNGATDSLNELVQKSAWDSQTWWSIVSQKYHITPLELDSYEEPLKTIQNLNQSRAEPIKILGLAPDCRFQSLKTKSAVTACLSKRERTMESHVQDAFPARSNGLMIISAGYRHAQLAQSDHKAPEPLAMRLAEDHSVQSVLLSGQEKDGRSTCKGLFDSLESEQLIPLKNLPQSALTTACLSPDPNHDTIPLSAAFTHLWHRPLPWRSGDTLPLDAWSTMGEETLRGWSRFRFELLGDMELGPNPQAWKAATDNQMANHMTAKQGPFQCSVLPQLTTEAAQ